MEETTAYGARHAHAAQFARSLFPSAAVTDAQHARLQEERARELSAADADRTALLQLAEDAMPADVRQLAENIKCPELMRRVWLAAYAEGWRARHELQLRHQAQEET